jgi:hypothetical protein
VAGILRKGRNPVHLVQQDFCQPRKIFRISWKRSLGNISSNKTAMVSPGA